MKEVREVFGLTQEQLAGYLGLSRTQLSLAESKNRRMGTAATIKCVQLLQLSKKKLPVPPQLKDSKLQTAFNKELLARIRKTEWRIITAKKKLREMQADFALCSKALQAVNELLPQLPQGSRESKRDRLWLEMLEAETMEKLQYCSEQAQGIVQLDIDAWEFEKGKAKGMVVV